MIPSTLIGPSHIWFLNHEEEYKRTWSFPQWDPFSFFGATSMPIFHDEFIRAVHDRKDYHRIYIFPFRSVCFNRLHRWMKDSNEQKVLFTMNHDLFVEATTPDFIGGVDKSLLKDEAVIETQNLFFMRWLDFYAQNFSNVRFVFWCHFGEEFGNKCHPPHLDYTQLHSLYPAHSINLTPLLGVEEFPNSIFRDGDWHPSPQGFECIRKLLEEDINTGHV